MPATNLSFANFKGEVAARLDGAVSKSAVDKVFKALIEEAHDCLTNGYVVSVPGLFKATPLVKAGRKKGTVVRNPFDGTEKTLRADEPDKFVVKIGKSASITKKFPSIKTKAGKELYASLVAKPEAKSKRGK